MIALPRLALNRRLLAIAVALSAMALPSQALALRYADPAGSSSDDCQTPATACDLETAIEGDGGSNVPTNGEEVIVLTGSYSVSTNINQGASNLNVHGDIGQPRPVITMPVGAGRLDGSDGVYSYLELVGVQNAPVNISGITLIERVLMRGSYNGSTAVCQCYGGTVRNSAFVSTGTAPALGVSSNGGSGGATYRNVSAYSTNAGGSAIAVGQFGPSGTLTFTAYNAIALNTAGGNDVVVDGPNPGPGTSSITFDHSNYRTVSTPDGGQVLDTGGHQTALPEFTNAAGGDFSELATSPTIDAGLTDPLNGALDFAGNPRTVNGTTDIGAYEFVPPAPTTPTASSSPPTFTLGAKKVKVNRKGKGRLGFICTSPPREICVVSGTLSAGGAAKRRSIGQVSGTVPGGSAGTVLVKLNKTGRKRLAAKRKLRASLSGQVTSATGQSSPLAASLTLKPKR